MSNKFKLDWNFNDEKALDKAVKREFDGKNIEKTAEICYNENNHKLKNRKAVFYGTNSNFL